ncbi:MAG: hypothetical protein JWN58_1866, partial [Gammaproteobacteria bacterium]|nr:hypothetical protein [Gammaproteobacteria bacterium]
LRQHHMHVSLSLQFLIGKRLEDSAASIPVGFNSL